jgi:hypothetical protein
LTNNADERVLLVQEETVLQDIKDRLNEFGRCYGMEIIMGKRKVKRISRQPYPVQMKRDENNWRIWGV